MAKRRTRVPFAHAWDASVVRPSPDCFAWWWSGTRSFPTPEGGCRAGARTCTPTEGALSKLNVVDRSYGCFAAQGRSISARSLTILDTANRRHQTGRARRATSTRVGKAGRDRDERPM